MVFSRGRKKQSGGNWRKVRSIFGALIRFRINEARDLLAQSQSALNRNLEKGVTGSEDTKQVYYLTLDAPLILCISNEMEYGDIEIVRVVPVHVPTLSESLPVAALQVDDQSASEDSHEGIESSPEERVEAEALAITEKIYLALLDAQLISCCLVEVEFGDIEIVRVEPAIAPTPSESLPVIALQVADLSACQDCDEGIGSSPVQPSPVSKNVNPFAFQLTFTEADVLENSEDQNSSRILSFCEQIQKFDRTVLKTVPNVDLTRKKGAFVDPLIREIQNFDRSKLRPVNPGLARCDSGIGWELGDEEIS